MLPKRKRDSTRLNADIYESRGPSDAWHREADELRKAGFRRRNQRPKSGLDPYEERKIK